MVREEGGGGGAGVGKEVCCDGPGTGGGEGGLTRDRLWIVELGGGGEGAGRGRGGEEGWGCRWRASGGGEGCAAVLWVCG